MIDSEQLRVVLADWNFWDRDLPSELVGHPRRLTGAILEIATGREAVAIVGVRRCGKTTILFQIMDALLGDGAERRSMLYVNFEDHRFSPHLEVELLDRIVSLFNEEVSPAGPKYIFLDEPQEVPGWERWVRGLYDRNCSVRIFVTGSSSSMMSSDLSTLLTGRNITFSTGPFSFAEYLSFLSVDAVEAPTPVEAYKLNLANRGAIAYHLARYMEQGGFPEALKSASDLRRITLLQQYFDDILAKDVVHRHRLRNPRMLRDLALVLMSDVSKLASLGRLSRAMGTSASSVSSLLAHLEEARLLATTYFFSFSTRESVSVQKPRKIYAADTGMRNAVVARHSQDVGHLAENLVHNHLTASGWQPTYWKERVEVDFVLGRTSPVPVNVCFSEEIPDRELQGLERFYERFGNDFAWLVTKSTFREERIAGSDLIMCPLWAFLLSEPAGYGALRPSPTFQRWPLKPA